MSIIIDYVVIVDDSNDTDAYTQQHTDLLCQTNINSSHLNYSRA